MSRVFVAFVRSRGVLLSLATLAFALLGFVPLFGGPGYEYALGAGLLVSPMVAVSTAFHAARGEKPWFDKILDGIRGAVLVSVLCVALTLAHGFRVGMCDALSGLYDVALGPLCGFSMAAIGGASMGAVVCGRKRARFFGVLLAIAMVLASAGSSLARFVTSPIIFAFDTFIGYFSGTLYDTVIDTGSSWLTFRVGSLCTAVAVLSFAHWRKHSKRGALGLGALAAIGSVAIAANGPKLGHFQTTDTIQRELGGFARGSRCDVVYPAGTRPDKVDLLVRDCDEEVFAVEQKFGAKGPDRLTAFFFTDTAQKKRLMGAADTYIAKPWRREVYLQVGDYPHPVLGHEIAHVVAGAYAPGPFHVAGKLGGALSNPGLIEGMAVAGSPDDDELTDEQWAKAMLDLGILPPMKSIFSMSFLGQNSSKAYTLAGAFVSWSMSTFGKDKVRAWYGGADIEALTGKNWDTLDAAFREHVKRLKVVPAAMSLAKSKFDRPGIFGRKCPHVIDAVRREADQCRERYDVDKAEGLYAKALALDPHDVASELARATIHLRFKDRGVGIVELSSLSTREPLLPIWHERAKDALADAAARSGDGESASALYKALAEGTVDEDLGRTYEVKAELARSVDGRRVLQLLLIGFERRYPETPLGALGVARFAAQGSPLGRYLLMRQLVLQGLYADALAVDVKSTELTVRIRREYVRLTAVAGCVGHDAAAITRAKAMLVDSSGAFADSAGGRRESLESLLSRCGRPLMVGYAF